MNPFNDDGHRVGFKVSKDVVEPYVVCPRDDGTKGRCNQGRSFCVVRRFVNIYGLELCLGSTTVVGEMPIAWFTLAGDSDLDAEVGAVFFTFTDDQEYVEMLRDLSFPG